MNDDDEHDYPDTSKECAAGDHDECDKDWCECAHHEMDRDSD